MKNSNIVTIANFTTREMLRSNIFYGSLIISGLIVVISLIASSLSYLEKSSVILDFGMGLNSLYSAFLAIYFGSGLLSNEIESRTLYCTLSRPIERSTFVIGKILGVVMPFTIIVTWAGLVTLLVYSASDGNININHFYSIYGILLESLTVFSISLFTSLFANKILSSLYTFIILIFGHGLSDLDNFKFIDGNIKLILKGLKLLLPNISLVNYKNYAVYHQSLSLSIVAQSSMHIIFYMIAIFCMTIFLFNKKDLD